MGVFRILIICSVVLLGSCGMNKSEGFSVISSDVKFGEKDYENIVVPSNELGFSLLNKVEPNSDNNVFLSPASLYMLLSIVYNGAEGKTKEEMAELLRFEDLSKREVNEANASLLHSLYKASEKVKLHIANSLWLDERFTFEQDFVDYAEKYFNGEIKEVPLSSSKTVKEINSWVKKATNNLIEEIVEGPFDERSVSFLVNAIYFSGEWTYSFNKELVEDVFNQNGERKLIIPFMKLERKLPYVETDRFQGISLPYGNGEMMMNIFLPKEKVKVDDLAEEIATWQGDFEEREGTLLLPKFKLEYETTLNEPLIALGMKDAFSEEKANFSAMIKDDEIYLNTVKQKTFISVHEEGTEAAGVTSAEFRLTSAPVDPPFYMEVDRPFIFTILDKETGIILFVGKINRPT